MEHKIDLSAVPHKPGQSTDLEAKRARAWERLTEDEREYVVEHYGDREPENQPQAPFLEVKDAYERVLYILAVTGQRFTPMDVTTTSLSMSSTIGILAEKEPSGLSSTSDLR